MSEIFSSKTQVLFISFSLQVLRTFAHAALFNTTQIQASIQNLLMFHNLPQAGVNYKNQTEIKIRGAFDCPRHVDSERKFCLESHRLLIDPDRFPAVILETRCASLHQVCPKNRGHHVQFECQGNRELVEVKRVIRRGNEKILHLEREHILVNNGCWLHCKNISCRWLICPNLVWLKKQEPTGFNLELLRTCKLTFIWYTEE